MKDTARPGRLGRVVTREIAGETLLVPIRADVADMHHIFALNPVGAHIWKALDGKATVADLVESVCEVFEVEEDRARTDVLLFLDELVGSGLVKEI